MINAISASGSTKIRLRRHLRYARITATRVLICVLFASIHDAIAQSPANFPDGDASVDSIHKLSYCVIEGPPSGIYETHITIRPVTNLLATLNESCTNIDAYESRYWTLEQACTPVPIPNSGQVGALFATFFGDSRTAIYKQDGTVITGAPDIGNCGCDSNSEWPAGVGADGNCYCFAGHEWDASTSSCVTPKYFTRIPPDPIFDQGNCCSSSSKPPYFGDPVNVATGEVFKRADDLNSGSDVLPFRRYFNSSDAGSGDLSDGWRHSYSRNIVAQNTAIEHMNYVQAANTSSQYSTDQQACENGFAELQPRVPTWSGATATYYGNGNCQITKGGALMGLLTVYANYIPVPPVGSPLIYRVTRDDGQVIRFLNSGGIVAPPTISLKLQQTQSGFTITDANDNVEQYDTNGKLLTVISRSGVGQTMNYDSNNRLSSVVDSFGHQLTFSYDAQGHLTSVTRQ